MGTYLPGLNFPIFSGWTAFTPVLPKLYWNVYSAEQRLKELCMSYSKVDQYLDYVANMMNEWNVEFSEEMQKELEEMWYAINNGLENAVADWIQKNLTEIFNTIAKQVYFGLNEQGYFVAYIPEGWDDIIFDTGMVYGEDTYGRLMLRWDVDNSGESVNQRPEVWEG